MMWGTAALALVGAGCAGGAPPPLPADFDRYAPRMAAEPQSPPPLPTAPLTVAQAIALAQERNPDLRAASARISMAEAAVDEAASSFYPQLHARLSYARTDNPAQAFGMIVAQRRFSPTMDVNSPGATQNWRPELVATYSLFRGFQDANGVDAARRVTEIAGYERAAIRHALAQAVTETYLVHLAAQQQVDVSRASVKAIESELADSRKRFDAGALLKSDLLSLEVRLAAAKDGELRAANGVELARISLRVLLALGPGESVEFSSEVPPQDATLPADRSAALDRASELRPELRAARRFVDLRKAELAVENGGWYPTLDAYGAYGQDAPNLVLSGHQDNWSFGLTLDLPLFSGFRTRARVSAAERRVDEARAMEDKERLAIEQEVRTALLHRQEAVARVDVADKAILAAEEALRLVREQYQAGTATITRFLEAEAALTEARSRVIGSRLDMRRAETELRKAIGDWK
jgi:outer membrane protein TolC